MDDEEILQRKQAKRAGRKRDAFVPRRIEHPFFQNIAMENVMAQLSEREAGDCLFTPSSKGPSSLRLSIKLFQCPEPDYEVDPGDQRRAVGDRR